METKTLALDFGAITGWACKSENGTVDSGFKQFKIKLSHPDGYIFKLFYEWLSEQFDGKNIGKIYYEDVHRHIGTAPAHAFGGYRAILWLWANKREIPTEGLNVRSIKLFWTGKGNATKDDMIAASMKKGANLLINHNENDAIAILAYGLSDRSVPLERPKPKRKNASKQPVERR
jgi:Holliday junction resolvasome RuvABC endonuclease subunit